MANVQMLIWTFFHPWTLRSQDADEYVPYAGNLRSPDASWDEVMSTCLDGHVISHEYARYVGNVLSVLRVRPRDDEEDARSDEEVNDEEKKLKVMP